MKPKRKKETLRLLCHIGLIAACAFFLFFGAVHQPEKSKEKYLALIAETVQSNQPGSYQAEQQRQNVHRELFITKKSGRLKTTIDAASGKLILEGDGRATGFVEHFTDITCLMQEELIWKEVAGKKVQMQKLRLIQAGQATFDYTENTLNAGQMKFATYEIPGHDMPLSMKGIKPTIAGEAESAVVVFTDNEPEFKAKRLKMILPETMLK